MERALGILIHWHSIYLIVLMFYILFSKIYSGVILIHEDEKAVERMMIEKWRVSLVRMSRINFWKSTIYRWWFDLIKWNKKVMNMLMMENYWPYSVHQIIVEAQIGELLSDGSSFDNGKRYSDVFNNEEKNVSFRDFDEEEPWIISLRFNK